MDINLINFLEELETKGLFKSKVGELAYFMVKKKNKKNMARNFTSL